MAPIRHMSPTNLTLLTWSAQIRSSSQLEQSICAPIGIKVLAIARLTRPPPYLDNIRIRRYKTSGPIWLSWDVDLSNDTFPEENAASMDPMEEFCRADPSWYDSCFVTCTAPLASGLDTLTTGEARVYCHVKVHFLGPDRKPDITGTLVRGITWIRGTVSVKTVTGRSCFVRPFMMLQASLYPTVIA